jgi:predicted aspartyl protease
VTARGVLTGLVAIAAVAAGCAATNPDQASPHRGDSGPVSWEIVGIRTTVSDDDQQIQWNFTIILRETAGRGIQFESIETSSQARGHPDSLMAGIDEQPFRARLAPRGEYRFNMNYRLSFTSGPNSRFGELPGGREGVLVSYRLTGQDESSRSITVSIPVSLHPGAGAQVRAPVTPPLLASPTVTPPDPAAVTVPTSATVPEAPPPSPAREAADQCAAGSKTLKILAIGEGGDLNFEHAPGEEDEFLACYKSRLHELMAGRLVERPDAPVRTSVPIEPFGTSFAVSVTLNGLHRARLLVDTGATRTILRPRLIERISGAARIEGLRPSLITASGETVSVSLVRLRALTVGSFELEGLHVAVYDVLPQEPSIDGLLGTDVLHRFVVNVDGRQLTLERKP